MSLAVPLFLAGLVAAPLAIVLLSLFAPADGSIRHLWSTAGPVYVANTLALSLLVGAGAGVLGTVTAAIAALTEFPGRRFFSVALALPLAAPAYIAAYAWGDLFGPFGAGTALLGPLDMKSLGGAAFVLALANYPYVYLAARASFEARSAALFEAAQMLGAGPSRFFVSVLIPGARAAIAGGLALALMETVADYGVADYAGVPTMSVGIFRTWRGLGDLAAASQLAGGLFLAALLLVLIEYASRRGLAAEGARSHRAPARLKLGPGAAALAILVCAAPFLLVFAAPALTLLAKLVDGEASRRLAAAAVNTALLASVGSALAVAVAAVLAISARKARHGSRLFVRAATLGYALPGAVVALAIVAAAGFFGIGFAAGLLALLYALVVRFSTAAFNAIDAGLSQIHPLTDDSARLLGAGPFRIARRIFLPVAGPSILAGALIVFIDICRELPATLLLRPFNFETLATEVYRLASDERLSEAAPAALILIGLSIAPTLLVNAVGRPRARP